MCAPDHWREYDQRKVCHLLLHGLKILWQKVGFPRRHLEAVSGLWKDWRLGKGNISNLVVLFDIILACARDGEHAVQSTGSFEHRHEDVETAAVLSLSQ